MNTISRDEDGAKERFDRLFANLCNYKTLRGAVIWEREFLKEHKNFLVDEEDLDIVEVYEQMAEEESLRTTPLETEMLTEIDSMRDEEGNIDFDRVFSQFDNDDIYAHSKRDLQDAVRNLQSIYSEMKISGRQSAHRRRMKDVCK